MTTYPVRVVARADRPGRWLWLVKWLLLVPHYVVLAVLWAAFAVLTLVAYVAVLATGRYPAGIADFNVGVLRWTWRVGYYGYWVLGTDRYPPFTLADVPDYPARLELTEPPHPKRWLPLVAWLFALPHILLVTALYSGGWQYVTGTGGTTTRATVGVVGLAVLFAGAALLVTGRYPAGLRDLLVGTGRWALRTTAYVALLTGTYPPMRLDQGDAEPPDPPTRLRFEAAKPPARRRPNTTARVVALVAGVVLLLVGGGAAVAGGAMLVLHANRDGAGYLNTATVTVSTATAAITAEDLELLPAGMSGPRHTGLDAVRLTATNHRDTPLFLGVARQADVDAWLAGTAHHEMTGMRGTARQHRMGGALQAVSPPVAQWFWLASATGRDVVRLDWTPSAGRFAAVVANADGTLSVSADLTAGAKVPMLRPAGVFTLISGLLATLVAGLLILLGALGLAGHAGPAYPPAPPDGTPPGPAPPVAARVPVSSGV